MNNRQHLRTIPSAQQSTGLHWALLMTGFLASLPALAVTMTDSAHDDGYPPELTMDGNLDAESRWSSPGGAWITYDLGRSMGINSVDIAFHQGDIDTAYLDIQLSTDQQTWTSVWTGKAPQSTRTLQNFDFKNRSARWVRVIGQGSAAQPHNDVTEVRINTSQGVKPAILPAEVLKLSNWKLTLPFDAEGNQGNNLALDVLQPALANFVLPFFFETGDAGSSVVFRANTGGSTTQGSGYPRSELREMQSDGRMRASWSSGTGKHTLFIRQSIDHVPSVKSHVVAGQIHDGQDDVIVFRLEGQKLFIDINGADGPILTRNYQLGDVFTAKFIVQNDRTAVYYNGIRVFTLNKAYADAYFKAGVYTQSACYGFRKVEDEACSDYGEVRIRELWVRHE